MARITLGGNPVETSGSLPKVGTKALDFELVATDLTTKTLTDFKNSNLLLNIFPSVDTGVCSASVRSFNKSASNMENSKVLCISRDLPFRQQQFCAAEGLENVVMLSDFKSGAFGKTYGLNLISGKFDGLNSRCVIIIDNKGIVRYTQQVPEIGQEPDYEDALKFLKNM